jgi:hypothetical protein
MSIEVFCQACNKTYRVRDEHAGKRGKCKLGHVFFIPRPVPPAGALGAGTRRRVRPTPLTWMLLGGCGLAFVCFLFLVVAGYIVFIRSVMPKPAVSTAQSDDAQRRAEADRAAKEDAKRRADLAEKAKMEEAQRQAAALKKAKDDEDARRRAALLQKAKDEEDAKRRADAERKALEEEDARRRAEAAKKASEEEAKKVAVAPPPLPEFPAGVTWPVETKKKIDRAAAIRASDPVSACLTLEEITRQQKDGPNPQQRDWLQKAIAVDEPRALEVLKRDLTQAAGKLDLHGAVLASTVSDKIRKNSLADGPAMLARLKADLFAGKPIADPVWKIQQAGGRRLMGAFTEGPFNNQVTLTPKPGFRLVHVSARVQNVSAASDPVYALWAFGDFKRIFNGAGGLGEINKKPAGPRRFACDELLYLLAASGELIPCGHVCETRRRLRGITITLNGAGGRVFFSGEHIEQGGEFQAEVIFSVPQDLQDARLLVLGAAPVSITGLK